MIPPRLSLLLTLKSMLPVNRVMVRAENMLKWLGQTRVEGLTHFDLTDVNNNVAQIESCAKCHARRGFVHPGHHANDSFLDHFLPEWFNHGLLICRCPHIM